MIKGLIIYLQTIVTDFNIHRLLVIKADFANAQYLGTIGKRVS